MPCNTYDSELAKQIRRTKAKAMVEQKGNVTWVPFDMPVTLPLKNPRPEFDEPGNEYSGFRLLPRAEQEGYLAEVIAHYQEGSARFRRDIKWMKNVIRTQSSGTEFRDSEARIAGMAYVRQVAEQVRSDLSEALGALDRMLNGDHNKLDHADIRALEAFINSARERLPQMGPFRFPK